ncbi:MAG TPA: hypothetical protein VM238_12670 [Phycisphaerae bacterium]|nr:hypothetical protein [Phycisphaerae bacterium]
MTFYRVAYGNYLTAERIEQEREAYRRAVEERGRRWTDADLDHLMLNHLTVADEERPAIVCVVFCAAALEALINDYAICALSKGYLQNYLDRLQPLAKWLVFPRLIARRQMDTDGQAFQGLAELFRLRNDLVHFKRMNEGQAQRRTHDRLTHAQAGKAVGAVRGAAAELKRLDKRVRTDWVAESEAAARREMIPG